MGKKRRIQHLECDENPWVFWEIRHDPTVNDHVRSIWWSLTDESFGASSPEKALRGLRVEVSRGLNTQKQDGETNRDHLENLQKDDPSWVYPRFMVLLRSPRKTSLGKSKRSGVSNPFRDG